MNQLFGRVLIALAVMSVGGLALRAAATQLTRPFPGVQQAVIIRVDDLRPGVLAALATAGIAEHTTGSYVLCRDLTRISELGINTEDTCATACYLLGLSPRPYFDGKPVLAAFAKPPTL